MHKAGLKRCSCFSGAMGFMVFSATYLHVAIFHLFHEQARSRIVFDPGFHLPAICRQHRKYVQQATFALDWDIIACQVDQGERGSVSAAVAPTCSHLARDGAHTQPESLLKQVWDNPCCVHRALQRAVRAPTQPKPQRLRPR